MSNEFVEKDNNVGFIITIVFLIFIILGLGGFIIYDFYVSENNECRNVIDKKENDIDLSYELTYSDGKKYIDKINIYNGYLYEYFLMENKKEITNDVYLTFAYRMINLEEDVTVEKVDEVLKKYFGKNVKYEHDDIHCFAGEVIYEYDPNTKVYNKKEHSGHGGSGVLGTEIYYVSSKVTGNRVKFVTKNVYERFCGGTCGPINAYYGTVEDVFNHKNPVLVAPEYSDEARIYRDNLDEVLSKVDEVTYNFIIEDDGNFYLESVVNSK